MGEKNQKESRQSEIQQLEETKRMFETICEVAPDAETVQTLVEIRTRLKEFEIEKAG